VRVVWATLLRSKSLVVLALLAVLAAGWSPGVAGAAPGAKTKAPVTVTAANPARTRTVTFVNELDQTIWVAGWQETPEPALARSGWVLPAGKTLSIKVPGQWNGRFWARTGCRFDKQGRGHCQTGGCNGLFQCKGYGAIPATLAEYDMDAYDHLDFYDVSMVDGSNVPLYITTSHATTKDPITRDGCIVKGCTKAVACPVVLRVRAGGKVVGCISACAHFGTDQYCCRGKWSSRAACQPRKWPVDYAAVFKRAEPYAYSYVYDDATSLFTCAGGCDYRLVFGLSPKGARP
jgi:Thaumatin family